MLLTSQDLDSWWVGLNWKLDAMWTNRIGIIISSVRGVFFVAKIAFHWLWRLKNCLVHTIQRTNIRLFDLSLSKKKFAWNRFLSMSSVFLVCSFSLWVVDHLELLCEKHSFIALQSWSKFATRSSVFFITAFSCWFWPTSWDGWLCTTRDTKQSRKWCQGKNKNKNKKNRNKADDFCL